MKRLASIIKIGILSSLVCVTIAQTSQAGERVHGTTELITQINRAVLKIPSNTRVGIAIKSMKYGDTIYAKNEQSMFTPASTLKIFTAEAALLFLGPSFKFPTRFVTDARSKNNGIIQGNVYLVNSGDPTLTYADLIKLMETLKAQQIREISGNLYIDNTAYDLVTTGPGWLWNDKQYCYAAPISASIINHNCPSVQITSKKSKSYGTRVITDVMQYDKFILQSLFNQYGIHVRGMIMAGKAVPQASELATHQSKPLYSLVKDMLKKSDNIIAGSLFKKVGALYSHRPGTWENGGSAVSQILSQYANVDIWHLTLTDGSGLSRYNQVTPSQMLKLLDFTYHNPATNYDFISALPIGGVDGTLKRRMRNIPWRVRAKTGTIAGVVSLAGYATSADREPFAFVIMINGRGGSHWQYRELEDKILMYLTQYSRA